MVVALAAPEVEGRLAAVDVVLYLFGHHGHMRRLVKLVAASAELVGAVVLYGDA